MGAHPPPLPTRQDPTRAPRWGWIIALGAAGLLLMVSAFALRSIERPIQLTLAPEQIRPLEGQAFQVDLKRRLPWPWLARSDNPFNLYRSDLLLFEDGHSLGPPHAPDDQVHQDGGGGYLHWAKLLNAWRQMSQEPTRAIVAILAQRKVE